MSWGMDLYVWYHLQGGADGSWIGAAKVRSAFGLANNRRLRVLLVLGRLFAGLICQGQDINGRSWKENIYLMSNAFISHCRIEI